MNRRSLLRLVGRAGGTAAVFATMNAMGLLHQEATGMERPKLAADSGAGVKVAIIGAGLAGMTAAYELRKAGYDCTILEARDRAGGRCWTIRAGDRIDETDSQQICQFGRAEHMYFNPGPARIPYHHQGLLSYCQELGVPMQVIVNDNRAAYFQDDKAFGGQRVLNRRIINDSRGYMSELLAKAINRNALDEEISAEDRERILAFVRGYGNLDADYFYTGSSRAGYSTPPGAGSVAGDRHSPIDLSELLKSDFWQFKMHFAEGFNQAATMLEPVGGMDQISKAFERQVGQLITYNAKVTQIRKTEAGARILYTTSSGETQALDADFVICTLPLSVLADVDADFSPAVQQAIAVGAESYVKAMKIAFQADRRFWEEDDYIYGGISWTERDITQIWYPSAGLQQQGGILVAAYIWTNSIGERLGAMSPAQRLEEAIADVETIHPNMREEVPLSTGLSIAWDKVPYSQGGWIEWEEDSRTTAYPVLNEADGPIYFAGEHLSYLTGWQEGAVLSAHQAVRSVSAQLQALQA
ncbi:flavin monoamine oxidase family protein [Pseudanabaena sp. FACHB-2040]|uniref:flavin monoamine oxidase family protein n=1 Tax=Pseudanabaena sp. FACHB-2040 TaxID=2692859 RepID=UPI0016837975|nr:flavin monoamine oxidase family protein [Pseudanabaena sp. FACHB-2040]MBD2261215.1 flavin monoamine oxidase family protein [Pseudanabaena sp. FACHB-2040]